MRAPTTCTTRLLAAAAVIGSVGLGLATLGCNGSVSSGSRSGGAIKRAPGSAAPGAVSQQVASIDVTSPEPGSWLADGEVIVTGTVTDRIGVGITSVLVDGNPADLQPDGSFTCPVICDPGMDTITVRCENAVGDREYSHYSYMVGETRSADEEVLDAVLVRINPQAIPPINTALINFVGEFDLESALLGLNPIYTNPAAFGFLPLEITLHGVDYGTVDGRIELLEGGLLVYAEFHDVNVPATFSTSALGIDLDADLSATRLTATATASAGLDANGNLTIQLSPAQVGIENLGIANSPLPPSVESLVAGMVGGFLEGILGEKIDGMIPGFLDEQLGTLSQPNTIEVFGTEVTYQARPTTIDISSAGIEAVVAGNFTVERAEGVPQAPGYLTTPSVAPVLLTHKAFYASIDDDVVNKVLYTAWQGGIANLDIDASTLQSFELEGIDALTFEAISSMFPELEGLVALDSPIEIRMRPLLPPYLQMNTETAPFALCLGQTLIEILVENNGAMQSIVTVKLQARVGLDIGLENGELRLTHGTRRPTFLFDVVDQPLAVFNELRIQTMLTIVVDAMLPGLLDVTRQIQVPSFLGLQVTDLELTAEGSADDYLTLSGNLVTVPVVPDASGATAGAPGAGAPGTPNGTAVATGN